MQEYFYTNRNFAVMAGLEDVLDSGSPVQQTSVRRKPMRCQTVENRNIIG